MPIELLMPALSPTMTEGNLAKWHKKEGDAVKAGDVIAEIETDKATMEFEAVDEGTIGKILVPEGAQGVKVNQPIAVLLEEGEDKSALANVKPAAAPAAPKAAPPPAAAPQAPAPQAARAASRRNRLLRRHRRPLRRPPQRPRAGRARVCQPAGAALGRAGEGRYFRHPRQRPAWPHRQARCRSGAERRHARRARPRRAQARAPVSMPASSGGGGITRYSRDQVHALAGGTPFTDIPITGMRRVIANRLAESEVVPHYFLTVDCELDALLKARADINDALGVKTSVNDFVIKATALALRKVPMVNASWSEDAILKWEEVHVSVAVALPEGLITPIIKNADKKAIPLISSEMRELAERAKSGKLKLEEFQGGTISVSNLGMYGTRQFTAVINPPQSAIIAVGAGDKRPVVKNDQLTVATVMSCTGTFDHRVVDGALGAQFMAAFKKLIEAPAALLI